MAFLKKKFNFFYSSLILFFICKAAKVLNVFGVYAKVFATKFKVFLTILVITRIRLKKRINVFFFVLRVYWTIYTTGFMTGQYGIKAVIIFFAIIDPIFMSFLIIRALFILCLLAFLIWAYKRVLVHSSSISIFFRQLIKPLIIVIFDAILSVLFGHSIPIFSQGGKNVSLIFAPLLELIAKARMSPVMLESYQGFFFRKHFMDSSVLHHVVKDLGVATRHTHSIATNGFLLKIYPQLFSEHGGIDKIITPKTLGGNAQKGIDFLAKYADGTYIQAEGKGTSGGTLLGKQLDGLLPQAQESSLAFIADYLRKADIEGAINSGQTLIKICSVDKSLQELLNQPFVIDHLNNYIQERWFYFDTSITAHHLWSGNPDLRHEALRFLLEMQKDFQHKVNVEIGAVISCYDDHYPTVSHQALQGLIKDSQKSVSSQNNSLLKHLDILVWKKK